VDERSVTVTGPEGLHARPASEFCRMAGEFRAHVRVRTDRGEADATSILEILGLDVRRGDTIVITADGPDGAEAVATLAEILGTAPGSRVLTGISGAPGTGVAPAWLYQPRPVSAPVERITDVAEEERRLGTALTAVAGELEEMAASSGPEAASILRAQAEMAIDPALRQTAVEEIRHHHTPASRAITVAGDTYADVLAGSDNEYLAARASDVRDVCDRIARRLLELPTLSFGLPTAPSIVVARDLSPADTAALDPRVVRGLVTEQGSPTSHTAILARSLGVPAVVAVRGLMDAVTPGRPIGIDGDRGRVHLDPDAAVRRELDARSEARRERLRSFRRQVGGRPTATRDGHRVAVVANVRSVDEVHVALQAGAEGVGLLRTELLYLDRDRPPDIEEQTDLLTRMCSLLGDRRLIVRTFDIGADKTVRFLPARHEANPELGVRGIRLAMLHPALLDDQVGAVIRAAQAGGNLGVMAPMVATVSESEWFVERVTRAGGRRAGVAIGIMVEVPSAVLLADQLARNLDFLSIGTNDLTQYLHAADRRSADLTALQDAFSPALLRAVQMTCDAAHRHDAWVGVCGEAASDPRWATIAVGLGADELSVQAASLYEIRAAISETSLAACQAAAVAALPAPPCHEPTPGRRDDRTAQIGGTG
jgi:multiphosphoryl transfer protein